MTGSDVITGSMFCACSEVHPRLFFYYSSSTNVPLLMTESSMATGCDVTESDVIRSKVGDSPWGVFRIYNFFVAQSANFFPEFNIRLYDKNSESDYYFFSPPKSEYFFQQHWESEYFFRKKT